jgi:hypothetical protein
VANLILCSLADADTNQLSDLLAFDHFVFKTVMKRAMQKSTGGTKKARGGSVVRLTMSVDDDEDSDCVKTFSAEYAVDGTDGGRIGAILIDRDDLDGNFHAVCDEVSQDLQHVACQFCDSDGYCRVQVGDHAASTGGFLYITSLQLPAADYESGATDVASQVITQFLQHAELGGHWSLAVYIPECRTLGDRDEEQPIREARVKQGCAKDARAFIRAGFQQAAALENRFYTTASNFHGFGGMSHEKALTQTITERAPMSASDIAAAQQRSMADMAAAFGYGN